MRSSRSIQAVSLLLAVACLGIASQLAGPVHGGRSLALVEPINQKRKTLKMGFRDDMTRNLPPKYAILISSLGTLRALAIDMLWIKATKLREEGKHFQSLQLARWICDLAPRYPAVWDFQAWELAYNISVTTHTPEQRWTWVHDGLTLLRDRGIPFNPNALSLYTKLSWIFYHKMGDVMDDMHWAYKREWAYRLHRLLGAPPSGVTARETIAWFRRFVQTRRFAVPAGDDDELAAALDAGTVPDALRQAFVENERPLSDEPGCTVREPGAGWEIVDGSTTYRVRSEPGEVVVYTPMPATLDALVAADPRVGALLDQLAAAAIEPDASLLDALPQEHALLLPSARSLALDGEIAPAEADQPQEIPALLTDPDWADARDLLVAFVRADLLRTEHKLDPEWMLHTMEKYGPIDWRSTFAHSLYWSTYGDHVVREIEQRENIDTLQNDRLVHFAITQLMNQGRLRFEPNHQQPNRSYLNLGPDLRMIPACHESYIELGKKDVAIDPDREKQAIYFRAGHMNFLEDAILLLYFSGTPAQRAQAGRYYKYLRENFKTPDGKTRRRYLQPLEDFAMGKQTDPLESSLQRFRVAYAVVTAGLDASLHDLAMGNQEWYVGRLTTARNMYRFYMQETEGDPSDRRMMPPFDQMRTDAIAHYMSLPPETLTSLRPPPGQSPDSPTVRAIRVDQAREALAVKAGLWQQLTPATDAPDAKAALALQRSAYDRFLPTAQAQCEVARFAVTKVFPEPPGMDAYRQSAAYKRESGTNPDQSAIPQIDQPQ